VKVVEGRNLKKQDLFSENDAYVELYLDNKKRKQKTSIKYDQKTPVWNESFTL
jgi:Ca2+-dependent lipid-binding protein